MLDALSKKVLGKSFLETFTNIKGFYTNMKGLPEVKAYEANPNFNKLPHIPPFVKY